MVEASRYTFHGGSTMNEQQASSPSVEVVVYERKSSGIAQGAGADLAKVVRSLGDSHLQAVAEAIKRVQSKLQGVVAQADNYEVEFGLQLSGEAKALVVSTSAEATFTIRIGWNNGSSKKTANPNEGS